MKGINTSIFDFPTLRDPTRNYVYVDKTPVDFTSVVNTRTLDDPLCEPA